MTPFEEIGPHTFVLHIRQIAQEIGDETPPADIVRELMRSLWACFGRDRMRAMLKDAMDREWPSERERETDAMVGVYEALREDGGQQPMALSRQLFAHRKEDEARVESRIRKARRRRRGAVSI
jgi:hypothetical protein